MGQAIQQGNTVQVLPFCMVLSSDHVSPALGLTPTVTISKNGGAFGSPAGAVTEIGNGWYSVAANAIDANTLGPLLLHALAATADNADEEFPVVGYNPLDGNRLGLAYVPNAAPGSGAGIAVASNVPTAAQNATALWTDVTSSDFMVPGSPGGILVNQLGEAFATSTSFVFSAAALANAPFGATPAQIADGILLRNLGTGANGGHTVQDALRFLRNGWSRSANLLTVFQEDGVTVAWTSVITVTSGASPVTQSAPT